ncbi:MAG: glycoside hydrolase family 13 protein [Oscillospiraceae bacterium]|nr:glycoside hydrolase family 13 protein [Oscillospiraceae bacterium]
MRIHYNSRDLQYKTPFGTLRRGELCSLMLRIPYEAGAVGAGVVVEDCDGNFCKEIPMSMSAEDTDYGQWSCSFTMEAGLYFYWFRIYKEEDSFRLFKQGDLTNMELGDKWQLSFVPEDFQTPEYAKGAVMYQILPDRFYKSGDCDLSEKLGPYTIHENWGDLPRFGPDAQGHWNNDFFGGNFSGIMEKLPYLKELGVDILYLNPIFMSFSNHRYDTADYKRPDPMLGTEEDFKTLCQKAHELGIRVILDGVFSHTGDDSIYFDAKHRFGHGAISDPESPYRRWYDFQSYPEDYEAWWGVKTLPCVKELEASYLEYIIHGEDSVVAHWMDLGADGFRLDVADELPDDFILQLKQKIRSIDPQAFLIGEVWEDASNKRAYGLSRKYFVDGELDSVMNYPWRKAIIDFVTGADDGTAFAESVMSLAENYPPQVLHCVMNLLSSHDRPRILTVLGGGVTDNVNGAKEMTPEQFELGVERLKLASFMQFTLPGIPSIYYGDEAGLQGGGDPFCRKTFPWGQERDDLRDFFRELSKLRNCLAPLRLGTIKVEQAAEGRLSYTRELEGRWVKAYVNLSPEPWEIPFGGKLCMGRHLRIEQSVTLCPGGFALVEGF